MGFGSKVDKATGGAFDLTNQKGKSKPQADSATQQQSAQGVIQGSQDFMANARQQFGMGVLEKLMEPLAEVTFQQMMQAEQQGMPREQTLDTLVRMFGPQQPLVTDTTKQPQPAAGEQPVEQPGVPTQASPQQAASAPPPPQVEQPKIGPMQRMGRGFQEGVSGFMTEDRLLKQQELLGQKPLQEGEREKVQLQSQGELQKELLKHTMELEKAGKLTPEQLFSAYNKASQPFITVRDAYARLESIAKDETGVSDLSMIYSLMKIIDPGARVAEGDFANAENSGSVPERWVKAYNNALSGRRLPSKVRSEIMQTAQRVFKAHRDQHQKTVEQYIQLGERNNVSAANFITDVGLAPDGEEGKGSPSKQLPTKAKGAATYSRDQLMAEAKKRGLL